MDESEDVPKDFVKLKSEKLSVDEVSELVISPYCGTVSLFIGDATGLLNTEHLNIAWANAINSTLAVTTEDVPAFCPCSSFLSSVVPITEASVIIAVSSPHRAESLEAVMYCINTLKASVPIWKKEIYEDEYSWKENKECFWANSEK
ncbi:MOC2B synthase, partial [Burhinus bistriatus]|nr:MOC2B synthase [Burhinus bistriatus]